jgi:hypothetical protein
MSTNTATNTQTATATGGAGGSATGGNAGPSPSAAGGSQSGSYGGNAYANGGSAQSYNTVENEQSNGTSARDTPGYSGNRSNRGVDDAFGEISVTKPRKSRSSAPQTHNARSPARSGSGAASDVNRPGAEGNRGHDTGKASETGKAPLGGDVPGHGRLPPDQQKQPFFSLLSASGGAGTGLTLLLFAVLGAAIALPRERSLVFRPPTVPWRPLAYIPPIELPG